MKFRATPHVLSSPGLYRGNFRSPNWFPSFWDPISNTFSTQQREGPFKTPTQPCSTVLGTLASSPRHGHRPSPAMPLAHPLHSPPAPFQHPPSPPPPPLHDAGCFCFGSTAQEALEAGAISFSVLASPTQSVMGSMEASRDSRNSWVHFLIVSSK